MSFLRDAAGLGKALVYTLEEVDRTDHPAGKGPGGPGKCCSEFLSCSESRQQCKFESIVKEGSPFVLYATEKDKLVFLEFDDKDALWAEPFLDRGARKLVKVGSRVVVCSFDTAKAWIEEHNKYDVLLEGRCSFVFNCGRCGSTLMHKALVALDVQSSSEPHWCDQLGIRAPSTPRDDTWRALVLCLALEFHLSPRPDAKRFSLNPKNVGGGAFLADIVAIDFPKSTMCFMYRSCEKVMDSFGRLLNGSDDDAAIEADRAAWAEVPPLCRVATLPLLPLYATALEEAAKAGNLPFGEASRAKVAMEFCKWFDAIVPWLQLVQKRHDENLDDPITRAVSIRYDDFVAKETREDVLVAALRHLGGFFETDGDVAKAVAVFETNSQAGSAMTAHASAPFLTDQDKSLARRCVSSLEKVLKVPVKALDGGANLLLPNSLGAKDCPTYKVPEMSGWKKFNAKVTKFEENNCAQS